jgi:signal transduction histidine kinase
LSSNIGVRGRLLLAFLGICGLAVLGAVVALFAFSDVESVVDRVTQERMPASLASLELSRQAERIAAAAPSLLASTTAQQQQQTEQEIRSELAKLEKLLAEIRIGRPDATSLEDLEASVAAIKQNLAQLQQLVTTRLQLVSRRAERLRTLSGVAGDINGTIEWGLNTFNLNLRRIQDTLADFSLTQQAREKAAKDLARETTNVQFLQSTASWLYNQRSLLTEASTASEADLPHLTLNLNSQLSGIDRDAERVPYFFQQQLKNVIAKVRALAEGEDSIPDLRRKELDVISQGERLIGANRDASMRLAVAVNQLVDNARTDIARGANEVQATQRTGATLLIAVVVLSLLSSALIVWLYVGRSIIRRLTALSDSMLAIAGGQLRTALPAPGRDEIGKMAEALRVFRDTAVEVEEKSLRERQIVLDTIEYGVLILNSELRVRMFNRAFRDLWGIAEEDLRGQPSLRHLLEAYRGRGMHGVPESEWSSYIERRVAEVVAADSPPQEWQRPDGRVLQYEIVPLPDGGRMLTYFDLTRLKTVEGELRTAKEQAEARSLELAARVKELRKLGKDLANASKHKSQFLANMSHELRTPLNAILGYTELILDGIYGGVPEKMQGVLERVQSNGKHLLGLINDVLDLSKIEAGQLTLSLSDYSLDGVVQGVYTAVEPLAAEKQLRLRMELARGLPAGHGDERRLTQVLLNLVGNAIKFTNAGEVVIKAGASNGAFQISVADTGPGIAAADQTKIFEEFQQADNSSTRKKGGTGLGLSISKRIIEMHGGRLWVESELGRGAVFSFSIPIAAESQVGHA